MFYWYLVCLTVPGGDDHMRVLGVNVDTEDGAGAVAQPLRVGGILQGEQTDVASAGLGVEIVGAVGDSEEV